MLIFRTTLIAIAALVSLTSGQAFADEKSVDYLTSVKPLLKARCYACHGALKQEAGLRLDTAELIRKGGDSGEAVEPGAKAPSSLLIERVWATDLSVRMPPEHEGEPFKAEEVELLQKWISAGALGPADEQPEQDPKDHWAFLPVVRRDLPVTKNPAWVRNPIDAWIAAGHDRNGLTPQPEASRIVLLRRLSMDLIGLPPTDQEIAEFEADQSPDWYEKAVDRLLSDPRHGERWARHWMDIWRYSDAWGLGAQTRNSQRHIWHWRDWIVESLNRDAPYDEMVRLMLAGDELAPEDPEKLRATGYLARNYYIFNRDKWMEDVVTHVSKGFLGLTVNCAKCHDHKFDPISQTDYYKLRAYFEPYQTRIDMVPGEVDLAKNGIPRVFDAAVAPTYLYVRGDEARPDKTKVIEPGFPDAVAFGEFPVEPVELPESAWQPGGRSWVLENHLNAARERLQAAQVKLQKAEQEITPTGDPQLAGQGENKAGATFQEVIETFATLDASRWKTTGDGWNHRPGKLGQERDGPVSSALTLVTSIPKDFEAIVRFRLLGGSQWRSVGVRFDVVNTPSNPQDMAGNSSQHVYLSGATAGPKIQGAFSKGGKSEFPSAGQKSYNVEVGKEYTLQVRVRGNLVNASVNGKHILSWRTPLERRDGALQLTTFDALAEFEEFRLSVLDSDVPMLEPNGSRTIPASEALELAKVDVRIAEAELNSLELRSNAIVDRQRGVDADALKQTKEAAIRSERQLVLEKARRDVMVAEAALKYAEEGKRKEAEKKLSSAQKSYQTAADRLNAEIQPTDEFTLPQGAVWTATRFQFTGRDDPEPQLQKTSSGRRSSLANWVTDRGNPLTARVAVNHLWSRHFGTPLASNPFDLGRNSPTPLHSELIDWLASEFMDNQWSMKHLHRLIVTSSTYRMGSSVLGGEANLVQDPDNLWWWRRVPIRIEAQAVRDSILALAGELDSTIGGPSVPATQQEKSKRRSLYFYHSNNERNLFLTTFDDAEVGECYKRDQSIVPQQALALTNSGLVLDASRQIAKVLSRPGEPDADFVNRAFTVVLGIYPTDAEVASSLEAMERWKHVPEGSVEHARFSLIWILLNHNDFVTLR